MTVVAATVVQIFGFIFVGVVGSSAVLAVGVSEWASRVDPGRARRVASENNFTYTETAGVHEAIDREFRDGIAHRSLFRMTTPDGSAVFHLETQGRGRQKGWSRKTFAVAELSRTLPRSALHAKNAITVSSPREPALQDVGTPVLREIFEIESDDAEILDQILTQDVQEHLMAAAESLHLTSVHLGERWVTVRYNPQQPKDFPRLVRYAQDLRDLIDAERPQDTISSHRPE